MNKDEHNDCPYCGENIKLGATKCKHCHEMLYVPPSSELQNSIQIVPAQNTTLSVSATEITNDSLESRGTDKVIMGDELFREPNITKIIGIPYEPPKTSSTPMSIVISVISGLLSFISLIADSSLLTIFFLGIAIASPIISKSNSAEANKVYHFDRKYLAINTVLKQLRNILRDSVSIPDNFIKIENQRGLKHMELFNINNNISIDNSRSIIAWKENQDFYYTYDIDSLKVLEDVRLYADGTFKSGLVDNFNGKLPLFKIENVDFLFYSREGDFYIKTDVKGGGGGSDYANALVGGALFGGAGAVVASRTEVKIDSTTTEVDKRETILYYIYNGELTDAYFDTGTYALLRKLFPDKDSTVLDRLSKIKNDKSDNISNRNFKLLNAEVKKNVEDDVYVKLEKLSGLKEKGIITEEEFKDSKKKLLDKL